MILIWANTKLLLPDGDKPLEEWRQHRHEQHHGPSRPHKEQTEQEKGRPDIKLLEAERDSETCVTLSTYNLTLSSFNSWWWCFPWWWQYSWCAGHHITSTLSTHIMNQISQRSPTSLTSTWHSTGSPCPTPASILSSITGWTSNKHNTYLHPYETSCMDLVNLWI